MRETVPTRRPTGVLSVKLAAEDLPRAAVLVRPPVFERPAAEHPRVSLLLRVKNGGSAADGPGPRDGGPALRAALARRPRAPHRTPAQTDHRTLLVHPAAPPRFFDHEAALSFLKGAARHYVMAYGHP